MRQALPERYFAFARNEAAGRSTLYEELSIGVAQDAEVLARLSALPAVKQQPNLLFAAVKHTFGVQPDWRGFRATVLRHWTEDCLARRARSQSDRHS